MTSLTDRTIASLRAQYDGLSTLAGSLTDDQLALTSGAEEWPVAQVLSHLGSAAEIHGATLASAVAGSEGPGPDFAPSVWDRWNAMAPREQADGFVRSVGSLVAAFEALTQEQREGLGVTLGFVPEPLPVGTFGGMILNEMTQHGWDVRVALDPAATLDPQGAELGAEHYAGGLGFLLGFAGKTDQLAEPATVAAAGTGYALQIGDGVRLTIDAADATAELTGGHDALLRLISGRLKTPHLPADVTVSGNVSLADLQQVFPGY